MKNLLIGESGGPTAVINASLAGAIIKAKNSFKVDKIYCLKNGIEGIFKNEIYDFTKEKRKEIKKLKKTPGAEVGSCRYKLKEEELVVIKEFLVKNKIKYFLYIGGNDSMDTCNKIGDYLKKNNIDIRVIGIPKTIDNDLVLTDHTPGYLSAAKYVITTLREIKKDMEVYNTKSVTVVEIMGRNAGWLAASSTLADPDLIYLPEVEFSETKMLNDIKEILKRKTHVLIAVSEGIKLEEDSETKLDAFGHKQLGGICNQLKAKIEEELKTKTKAIELHIMQRCSAHIASKRDIKEAFKAGVIGLKAAINGETQKMVSFKRENTKIKYELVPLKDVANKEKKVPSSYINEQGNNVTLEFRNYLEVLLKKELKDRYPKLKKELIKL